jgi:hypothetical protein
MLQMNQIDFFERDMEKQLDKLNNPDVYKIRLDLMLIKGVTQAAFTFPYDECFGDIE